MEEHEEMDKDTRDILLSLGYLCFLTAQKEKEMKNLCAKLRPKENPYEIWRAPGWEWRVLKKWQADDFKPFGRWFCFVTSPFVPEGELGDCYASEIMAQAKKVT